MKTRQALVTMMGVALLGGTALAQADEPKRPGPRGDGQGFGPGCQGQEGGCPAMRQQMQRGGPGPGMEIGRRGFHNPQRLKEAGATDQQLEALKSFANEQQFKQIDLKAAVEKAEVALDQLMSSDTVDAKAALQAADALSQARAEVFKHEIGAKLKMQEILGAEVQKKLRQMGPPEGVERPGRGPRPEGQCPMRKDAPPAGERPPVQAQK